MQSRLPTTLEEKANGWIVSDDTGTSSITIWSVMRGVIPGHVDTPADLDDFGRCYRLLELIPEWKERLPEVAKQYPEWQEIVDNWDKLVREYKKPKPDWYLVESIIAS